MNLSNIFNKEHIQKIYDLNLESSSKAKKEMEKSLLALDKTQIKPFKPSTKTCQFSQAWDKFVNNTHSTEDLNYLSECFFDNQIFRSKGLEGKKDDDWYINGRGFNTPNIKYPCLNNKWYTHISFSKEYEFQMSGSYLLVNESNYPFELSRLYSIKNIDLVEKLYSKDDPASRDNFHERCSVLLKELLSTLDVSKLSPIKEFGYEIGFFLAWNKFVSNKELTAYEWHTLAITFAGELYMSKLAVKNDSVNISKYTHLGSSDLRCRKTGTMLKLVYDDEMNFKVLQWVNKKSIINGKEYQSGEFIEAQQNKEKDKIQEKTIVFKTGNLIINDWFRCSKNEFTNLIENHPEDKHININYASGVRERISFLADKFNFVCVNVSNTSPRIFKSYNKLYIGEGPDSKKIGKVCTDLWAASIIEEEHLVDLLIKDGMTKKNALTELKRLKEIWTCNSLKVKPGTYKLSFMGDYENFSKAFKKKNKVPKGINPYFALERISD